MTQFTRLELDDEMKRRNRELANIADFAVRRPIAYRKTIADLQLTLVDERDSWVFGSTFTASPPASGTAIFNTGTGDVFRVSYPTDCAYLAEDSIFLVQGTTVKIAARIDPDDWNATTTLCAFWEEKGAIVVYVKDGEITAPFNLHFPYVRELDGVPVADGTALDFRPERFDFVTTRTMEYMLEDLSI